jgi:hypothetical protein
MVREEQRMKATLGSTLESLYNKAVVFLDRVAEHGFSEEDATRIRQTLDEVGNSEVLKSLAGKI